MWNVGVYDVGVYDVGVYDYWGKAYPHPPAVSSEGARFPLIFKGFVVPEERLELSWPCGRRILSPLRLPVPPFRR